MLHAKGHRKEAPVIDEEASQLGQGAHKGNHYLITKPQMGETNSKLSRAAIAQLMTIRIIWKLLKNKDVWSPHQAH